MYIAVAGNIASGKTTIAREIAACIHARLILKAFRANPYLEGFYQSREEDAFRTQLTFLLQLSSKVQAVKEGPTGEVVVSDFWLAAQRVFSRVNLTPRQQSLFEELYAYFAERSLKPDVVVFLRSDTSLLYKRIRDRARRMEVAVEKCYLMKIEDQYRYLVANTPDSTVFEFDAAESCGDIVQALLKQIRWSRGQS